MTCLLIDIIVGLVAICALGWVLIWKEGFPIVQICMFCKKFLDMILGGTDKPWTVSHGICIPCMKKHWGIDLKDLEDHERDKT